MYAFTTLTAATLTNAIVSECVCVLVIVSSFVLKRTEKKITQFTAIAIVCAAAATSAATLEYTEWRVCVLAFVCVCWCVVRKTDSEYERKRGDVRSLHTRRRFRRQIHDVHEIFENMMEKKQQIHTALDVSPT